MNYDQLLYAVELSNHRTFQETADALHISKSGLSQSISQLEIELNVQLFERSHKGTILTGQGKAMMPYLKDMLAANLKLKNQASLLNNQTVVQTVRLAYANTFLKPMLTAYLNQQDRSHVLAIQCLPSNRIIERVRQHTLDAGFIAIDDEHEQQLLGLTFQPVHSGHISLITRPDNPLLKKPTVTLKDLERQDFALFNDPYNDQLFEHLEYLCGSLHQVIRVDDAWAMATVIKKLGAVCLARDWQAKHSTNLEFASLPKISIGHLINDRFTLGWVTNPQYSLSEFTTKLIERTNRSLQSSSSSTDI